MSSTASNYSPPPLQQTFHSPPITIVLTVVLLIFFLLGFFSVYFCRCFMVAVFNTWHLRRTPSGNIVGGNNSNMPPGGAHSTGLDPALIKSFPSFVYSSVKQVRKEKYGLECAICLVEFEDDSLLRLLTACYHVFHQECVDLWLESHKTCPVCRRDLDNSPHLFADKPSSDIDQPNNINSDDDNNNVAIDDDSAVTIDVKDEIGDLHEFRTAKHFGGDSSNNNSNIVERFSRSHSTGHSIARARKRSELDVKEEEEEEDRDDHHDEQERYRLSLPDHVKIKLLRGHHWTASCDSYGGFRRPSTIGRRFGEVSGSHH